jgi:hypothetical protein
MSQPQILPLAPKKLHIQKIMFRSLKFEYPHIGFYTHGKVKLKVKLSL